MKIAPLLTLSMLTALAFSPTTRAQSIGANGPVRNEADFARAIADPDRILIECRQRFVVTKDHNFGDKHLIVWPQVIDFSGGGKLHGSGSISRVAANADYPVFMNATVGFWNYYSGRVTHDGTNYASLPGQGTPPSVEGSWNNHERDVTLWSQWHAGRTNDAIEAAQNSLPRKGGTSADWSGTVILPEGHFEITRPIFITNGGKLLGAAGKGTKGHGGVGETELTASQGFGPEKKYPTGHASPIPGGGRLWEIPETYMVVFVPQNRNNQSRVNSGNGGGDGKSVFFSGLAGFQFQCAGRANGVLVQASSGSEIANVRVDDAIENAFRWHGSDAHVAHNIAATGSPVGFDFTGSNIDVTLDGVIFTQLGVGFRYNDGNNNRSASVHLRNVNSEGTKLLFHIRNPDAVSINGFTHTMHANEYRVGIVDVGDHDKGFPPFGFRLFGSVLSAGYIEVVARGERDQWRVLTSQVDNRWQPQSDWAAHGFGGKRGTIDFDLQREFGRDRSRRALHFPGAKAYNVEPLRF